MLDNSRFRGFAAASVLLAAAGCVTVAGCQGTIGDADDGGYGPHSGEDIQSALDALPSAVVVDVDEAGVPSFVTGNLGRLILTADIDPAALEAAVSDSMATISPVLRIRPENLALRAIQTDREGDQHLRFAQFRNGLEVLGGELLVHVREGRIFAFNGGVRGDLSAPSEPVLSTDGAVSAVDALASEITDGAVEPGANLAYFRGEDALRMVYVVRMTGVQQDGTPVVDDVLVDAVDGTIAARIPHIHTAKNRALYDLNHKTSLPGTLVRSEGGAAVSDPVVNTNYDLLGTTYDCSRTCSAATRTTTRAPSSRAASTTATTTSTRTGTARRWCTATATA